MLCLKFGCGTLCLLHQLPMKSRWSLQAGQTVGRRFCGWVGVPVPPPEVLPGYRRWPVQVPRSLLLRVLAYKRYSCKPSVKLITTTKGLLT